MEHASLILAPLILPDPVLVDFPLHLLFSDGWAKDDLIYKWKEKDPVQVVKDLHLPRFTLEQYKSAYCDVKTNTGKLTQRNHYEN